MGHSLTARSSKSLQKHGTLSTPQVALAIVNGKAESAVAVKIAKESST